LNADLTPPLIANLLGVLLGLVLVEQRHYLPDHVAHGIVSEFLSDRDQPDTGLGETGT